MDGSKYFVLLASPAAARPDGRTLATFGPDGITLLDLSAPSGTAPLFRLRRDDLPSDELFPEDDPLPTVVTFSPDGKTVVIGMQAGHLLLWDLSDRQRPVKLTELTLQMPVTAIRFAPDGRILAVGGFRGFDPGDVSRAVTVFDVTVPAVLAADPARHACAFSGRGLSAAEWTFHVPGVPFRATC